jgi:predicted nucleotidyltransferase
VGVDINRRGIIFELKIVTNWLIDLFHQVVHGSIKLWFPVRVRRGLMALWEAISNATPKETRIPLKIAFSRVIIAKTAGMADVLRDALAPLAERIETAFVHGSIARGTADAASDIDLFVIGDVSLLELAQVLPRAGLRLGRPVNPVLFTPAEFRRKRRSNSFVRTVLDGDKLDVIGSGHAQRPGEHAKIRRSR